MIGADRNLELQGLSAEEIFYLTQNDIKKAVSTLSDKIPGWSRLQEPDQVLWLRLLTQIGEHTLFESSRLVSLLLAQQYHEAAKELHNSPWSKESPTLSRRLVEGLIKRSEQS